MCANWLLQMQIELTFEHATFICGKVFSSIFILLSSEGDQNAVAISLWRCQSHVYHTEIRVVLLSAFCNGTSELDCCPFSADVCHTVPFMLSVKQGSYEYRPKSAAPEADPLTTQPFELLWDCFFVEENVDGSDFFILILRMALKKAVFALGFKKPSVITLWSGFEKSCLSQKLFVTPS